ncbi:sulfur carrier protein ThiS [Salipaludibacillus sp. CF4.18]|uniref:sulfur carrier protein ThiS n=1 Tax=Salipaludibacillus sp. CF4.18 TaxID=3373081 RepID=UPI003EE602D8
MFIQVNGKKDEIPESLRTIADLLSHYGLDKKVVIVEQNGVIIDKTTHSETLLTADDQLEFVHFVGGG